MPDRLSDAREKTDEDKAKDRKVLEDIEKDNRKESFIGENDDYPEFNPLAAQAERLPAGIKGADGYDPGSHIRLDGGHTPIQTVEKENFDDDEDLGSGVGDPSKLTAD